ncbi:MAG: dethiobiotin synthase [Rhodocyclaceae bacterium]|nr:dethiobiotin synthase [Rhodocyclaceae bacterium]
MSKAYFITATGTDIGKTWLTAGLVAAARARGVPVRALKPVMSGFDPAHPEACDAAKVGAGETALEKISPWRFMAPLSPDLAAAREGKSIDFAALVSWCRDEIATCEGLLIIEGIGGAMVPLDARHTVRNWIAALRIPTLLVCGTYLGALSHTLSALAALREVGIVPAALIVNESDGSSVSLADTLASLVPQVGDVPIIRLRRDDAAGVKRLAERLISSP